MSTSNIIKLNEQKPKKYLGSKGTAIGLYLDGEHLWNIGKEKRKHQNYKPIIIKFKKSKIEVLYIEAVGTSKRDTVEYEEIIDGIQNSSNDNNEKSGETIQKYVHKYRPNSHQIKLKSFISPRQYDRVLGKYLKPHHNPISHSFKGSLASVRIQIKG